MDNKREEGWYWITAWKERIIAYWDGMDWSYAGSDMAIPEVAVTDINEKRIIEDGI